MVTDFGPARIKFLAVSRPVYTILELDMLIVQIKGNKLRGQKYEIY
jgi:hypothetical protein